MISKAEKIVRICNRRGLHARAAAKFVKMVEELKLAVTVSKDGANVTGSSIMGLLMLAACQNSEIRITVEGAGADAALEKLSALVEGRFGEEE